MANGDERRDRRTQGATRRAETARWRERRGAAADGGGATTPRRPPRLPPRRCPRRRRRSGSRRWRPSATTSRTACCASPPSSRTGRSGRARSRPTRSARRASACSRTCSKSSTTSNARSACRPRRQRWRRRGAVLKGVDLVLRVLKQKLERYEVRPFDAAGQPFDPRVHEAISRVASAEIPAGSVAAELQKGYRVGERLLRPAMVSVSTGSAGKPATSGSTRRRLAIDSSRSAGPTTTKRWASVAARPTPRSRLRTASWR